MKFKIKLDIELIDSSGEIDQHAPVVFAVRCTGLMCAQVLPRIGEHVSLFTNDWDYVVGVPGDDIEVVDIYHLAGFTPSRANVLEPVVYLNEIRYNTDPEDGPDMQTRIEYFQNSRLIAEILPQLRRQGFSEIDCSDKDFLKRVKASISPSCTA